MRGSRDKAVQSKRVITNLDAVHCRYFAMSGNEDCSKLQVLFLYSIYVGTHADKLSLVAASLVENIGKNFNPFLRKCHLASNF